MNLKSVDALPPSVRRAPNPGVSWWPAVLKGNLDIENIHKAGFELYVVEKPATSVNTDILLFAVDWPKGRAFFYRTSEAGLGPIVQLLSRVTGSLKSTSTVTAQGGAGVPRRAWRYALILREKSEPRIIDRRIILKYACTQDFIEVFLLRRP